MVLTMTVFYTKNDGPGIYLSQSIERPVGHSSKQRHLLNSNKDQPHGKVAEANGKIS